MWLLTGPPRVAGITRAYADRDDWLECTWDDSESVWHEYDSGRRELYRAAYRLRGRYGVRAASEGEAVSLLSDLVGTFPVIPRTRLASDPDWADEHEVECRRTSALPATTLLARRDPLTGRPVWVASIEFEGVTVYDEMPGRIVGGLYKVGEGAGYVEAEPYGDAGLDVQTYEIHVQRPDGTVATGTYGYATLTPPPIEAARVRPRAGTNKAGNGIADVDLTDPPAEL